MKVDVVIPVYKPEKRLMEVFRRIQYQTYPVNRIIVMNTERKYWDQWVREMMESSKVTSEEELLPKNLDIFHVTKEEFDHGRTRHMGIMKSRADICVMMTDDALPADRHLIENLVKGLNKREDIAAAYGMQLPSQYCGVVERYTRNFNYPEQSRLKTKADLKDLGIKTYFCSNVCAAYKRSIYLELGGFIKKTIFNEDMIYAGTAIKKGYAIYYAADAKVIHSHNYTGIQQFKRNFDLAVSQANHPEIFAGIRSEGEGIRLVKQTARFLLRSGRFYLLPQLVYSSGCKYLGYLMGKNYKKLSPKMIRKCTMNQNYWNGILPEEHR